MNTQVIETLAAIEADSSNNLPSRIHLLRTGEFNTSKYGKLTITASDLNEFASNFKSGIGRPGQGGSGNLPVNFGHNKGDKAAAWINDLVVDGDNLYGNVEWTGSGKAAVEAKDWAFISSEFTPRCMGGMWSAAEDSTKTFRNVFTGAALTNIPMFNGNKGIMASAEGDNDQIIIINADAKELSMNLDQLRVKNAADLTAEEKTFIEAHAAELSVDEKTKFNIEASADKGDKVTVVSIEAAASSDGQVTVEASEVKAMLDLNNDLKQRIDASEAAKSDLQKTVDAHAEQLKDINHKNIEASVDQLIKEGKIVADQKDKMVTRIEADASLLEDLQALPANKAVEASATGADGGNSDVSASSELIERANKKAKEDNISFAVAASQITTEDSDLATRLAAERNVN